MVALAVVFAFSVGLGVATLAIPLLALGAGYGAATVGFLVATAAAAQFLTRLALPVLLGRFPDRTLIALSSMLMLVGVRPAGRQRRPARIRPGPGAPGRGARHLLDFQSDPCDPGRVAACSTARGRERGRQCRNAHRSGAGRLAGIARPPGGDERGRRRGRDGR
ncbi:MAG: hypothetical protein WKF78_11535 [Candidatus Limnocylindrales bacterium]